MKEEKKGFVRFSLRLPVKAHKKIRGIAFARNISINNLILAAIIARIESEE